METISTFAYLISAICFVMALRGLSGPETAQQGVKFGIAGMTIAIITKIKLCIIMAYVLGLHLVSSRIFSFV